MSGEDLSLRITGSSIVGTYVGTKNNFVSWPVIEMRDSSGL